MKTRASGSRLPVFARCARRISTAWGASGIVRRLWRVLRGRSPAAPGRRWTRVVSVAAVDVDVAPPEPEQLAAAEPGEEQQRVLGSVDVRGHGGEDGPRLALVDRVVDRALVAGELDAGDGVPRQPPVADGDLQRPAERPDDGADGRGREAGVGPVADEAPHVGRADLADDHPAQERADVVVDVPLVRDVRARRLRRLDVDEPIAQVGVERRLRVAGVHAGADDREQLGERVAGAVLVGRPAFHAAPAAVDDAEAHAGDPLPVGAGDDRAGAGRASRALLRDHVRHIMPPADPRTRRRTPRARAR